MAYYSQYTAAISKPLVTIDQVLKEKDDEIVKLRQRIFQLEQINASLNLRVHQLESSISVQAAHEHQLAVLAENREFSVTPVEEPGVSVIPRQTPKPKKLIFARVALKPVTTVVNVKVAHIRPEYDNLEEWMDQSNHVYIGRSEIVFINRARFPKVESVWANPYKVDKNGLEYCLVLYESWLRDKLEREGVEEFMKLKGKTLGCWCKPKRCHGDIIIKLLEELA